jgi:hypothetical protein
MTNLFESLSAKLLRLLEKDNLGVAPDINSYFGLDFETNMRCFLGGKPILTAITLVAYVVIITWLSRNDENSFNIYQIYVPRKLPTQIVQSFSPPNFLLHPHK